MSSAHFDSTFETLVFKWTGVASGATSLEDKQIEGYTTVGYKLDIPKELLGKEAAAVNAKPDISVWVSTEEGVPMLMQMAMQSAQFDMNMDMTFTHIHRVETPVAAFKIPEGYTAAPEKGAPAK